MAATSLPSKLHSIFTTDSNGNVAITMNGTTGDNGYSKSLESGLRASIQDSKLRIVSK